MRSLLVLVLLATVVVAQPALDSIVVRVDTTALRLADAPLMVVDGVVAGRGEPPFWLDPEAIVDVRLMDRDAALAAYGDEARNGVVRITTRQGGVAPDSADVPTEVEGERTVRAVIRAQADGSWVSVRQDTTGTVRPNRARTHGVRASQLQADSTSGIRVRTLTPGSLPPDRWPLFVIDGVRFPLGERPNPLYRVDPRDMEGIEVLRDEAATVMYGAAGMRGVVLVTTNNRARKEAAEAARNADAFVIAGVLVDPADDIAEVVLALPEAGEARVELRDGAGRIVRWAKGLLGAGAGAIRLNLDGVAPGTYTVRASADVGGERREATAALTIDP